MPHNSFTTLVFLRTSGSFWSFSLMNEANQTDVGYGWPFILTQFTYQSSKNKVTEEVTYQISRRISHVANTTHLNPTRDILDQLKALLKKAELPEIRFHDLRHSAATLLLSQGVHPKVVQEILGHSTISTTMDVYSHVLPSMQQEAITRLNTTLQKKAP
jgi:integrase